MIAVALALGVSERTVYKWLARYRVQGASPTGAGVAGADPPAGARPVGGVAKEIPAKLSLARSKLAISIMPA